MILHCLHPRFASLSSHHYNESLALQAECRRRGWPFALYMSVLAPAEIAQAFDGRRVLDDPTFRLELPYAERVERFRAQVATLLDAGICAEDRVLITVATQVEALALLRWREALPPQRRPWLGILILSDRWNRSTRAEYERQVAEYAQVRAAVQALAPPDAVRVLFFTLTQSLAQELGAMLGTPVAVAPVPLDFTPPPELARYRPHARPRVAVLGGLRREKGSHRLPAIVEACDAARLDIDWVLQLVDNGLAPEELAAIERLAQRPHVHSLHGALDVEAYRRALADADLGLFPYEVVPYLKRNSGVFAEAAAYGKPLLATAGTWMADQIAQGRAAGHVFAADDAVAVAETLQRCLDELPAMRERAVRLAPSWQSGGMAGFLDLIEARIEAARAAPGA